MVKVSKDIDIDLLQSELDALRRENALLKKNKRYGLIWEDHPEMLDRKDVIPLLAKRDDLSLPEIADKKQNYLIEGDNYHALKALQHTHRGAIDVIYIDPPYNTGNEFVYNDKIVDKDDSFRHSKWLSFMEKRLKLARELMSDDGVIFISIDDNEQAQLKLLCDAVFGGDNFLNNIVVKMSEVSGVKMSHVENRLPKLKEYVYVYSNGPINLKPIKTSKTDDVESFKKYADYYTSIIVDKSKPVSDWEVLNIREYIRQYEPNIDKDDDSEVLKFKIKNSHRVVYRTNNKTLAKLSFNTPVEQVISPTGLEYIWWGGKQMLFLSDNMSSYMGDLWLDISTINLNKEGAVDFKNGKKPLKLIQRLINMHPNNSATVLDFFAGSGTTGHAVMELNKEDGGDRNFILCTNNEVSAEQVRAHFYNKGCIPKNNKTEFNKFIKADPDDYAAFTDSSEYESLGIARAVTSERIKRVIEGYTTPKGKEVEGLPNNLTYLKTKEFDKKEQYGFNRRQLANLAYNSHQLKYPELNYESFQVDAFTDIDAIKLTTSKQLVAFINARDRESLADIVEQLTSRFGNKVIIETLESYFN